MNHVDKPESFDPEALRRKVSESRASASADGADEAAVELNPLAQKIALQFREDTYSPSMIIGLLRLGEFAALLATGYAIHALYVGVGMTALTSSNIVVVPIRSGVGLRLGANIGYLKFTPTATWNPF